MPIPKGWGSLEVYASDSEIPNVQSVTEVLPQIRATVKKLGLGLEIKLSEDSTFLWCNDNAVLHVQTEEEFNQCYTKRFKKRPISAGYAVSSDKPKQAYIRECPIAQAMKVIGHELGHILSKHINDPIEEEAKAKAFEQAWCRAINEHNLLGVEILQTLPDSKIFPEHAEAHRWIMPLIDQGYDPLDLYWDIVHNRVRSVA